MPVSSADTVLSTHLLLNLASGPSGWVRPVNGGEGRGFKPQLPHLLPVWPGASGFRESLSSEPQSEDNNDPAPPLETRYDQADIDLTFTMSAHQREAPSLRQNARDGRAGQQGHSRSSAPLSAPQGPCLFLTLQFTQLSPAIAPCARWQQP